ADELPVVKFRVAYSNKTFNIPSEWWKESGIAGFVPSGCAYLVQSPPYPPDACLPDASFKLVAIREIEPFERDLGLYPDAPLFNSDSKERLLKILHGFQRNERILPIASRSIAEDTDTRFSTVYTGSMPQSRSASLTYQ